MKNKLHRPSDNESIITCQLYEKVCAKSYYFLIINENLLQNFQITCFFLLSLVNITNYKEMQ